MMDECPAYVVMGEELEHFTHEDWNNILCKKEIIFART